MKKRILIIEDELAIADSVAYALRAEDYDVECALDGLEGLNVFRRSAPDFIILDLMLPKLSGLDFCRIIRKESSTPILMLTAKTEETDRIIGLEMGADDYLPKPFSLRELVARVSAVFRRLDVASGKFPNQSLLEAGNIKIDIIKRIVFVGDEVVHLPLKQYELLKTLMQNSGKVVRREELFRIVWGEDIKYDPSSLDVHMRWLRERIEANPSATTNIKTIRGVGYIMPNIPESI